MNTEPTRKLRALISVTNKDRLDKFKALTDTGKWEIISTGGTAKTLEDLGIPCIPIEQVTGFPEMMDGRLKTLHPKIFGGILADKEKESHTLALAEHGMELIDLVVVNLYDFPDNPGIENIDIGGPSLLRAAAKNGKRVTVVVDPLNYSVVIESYLKTGSVPVLMREALAIEVFRHTSRYDETIMQWLNHQNGGSIFGDGSEEPSSSM